MHGLGANIKALLRIVVDLLKSFASRYNWPKGRHMSSSKVFRTGSVSGKLSKIEAPFSKDLMASLG